MSTTKDDRTESVRSAWTRRLRQEALRMRCADVSAIVHVAIILATYADADGTNAHPGVETLAAVTGRSQETVSRSLQALAAIRLIERKRRPNASATCTLLLPLGDVDWTVARVEFEFARQAAARRRDKSARNRVASGEPDRRPDVGPDRRRDADPGPRNPVASGDPEPRRVGGSGDPGSPSRRRSDHRPDGGPEPRRVGGVHSYLPSVGDPLTDTALPGPVPQPQVRAREANAQDHFAPGLQAIEGGGRSTTRAQPPLLLPVPHGPEGPPAPLDARLLAERLTTVYGVPVRRDQALRLALEVLGGVTPLDPTGEVLAVIEADPERFRIHLPVGRRAAGDS